MSLPLYAYYFFKKYLFLCQALVSTISRHSYPEALFYTYNKVPGWLPWFIDAQEPLVARRFDPDGLPYNMQPRMGPATLGDVRRIQSWCFRVWSEVERGTITTWTLYSTWMVEKVHIQESAGSLRVFIDSFSGI